MAYSAGAARCPQRLPSKMKMTAKMMTSADTFISPTPTSLLSPPSCSPSLPSVSPPSSSSSWSSSSCHPAHTCSSLHQRLLVVVLLVWVLRAPAGAAGVQVQEVKVPMPGVVGRPAKMECQWTAGASGFYSVRWYKNNEQFYSFVPKNYPQDKVDHNLRGVKVELSESDEHVVTLRELRMDSEGAYRCEVMSESPTFQTSLASKNLTVVVLPEAPVLTGLRGGYRVGDTLNVTCTARNARPAATLSFYVNSKLVHPGSGRVQEFPATDGSYPGVYSSRSRLVLPLSERHAPTLTLTCYAHVLNLSSKIAAALEVEPPRGPILSFFNAGGGPGTSCLTFLVLVACFTHLLLLPYLLLPWNPSS
ncbi:uncharacterized protein [Procambarus clarkii]|uniref:uncharacterized protein n=1 Tax=Procambarus clarkii TaxID=6728 RepID=UPI003742E5DC